jgi:hypothetical protein
MRKLAVAFVVAGLLATPAASIAGPGHSKGHSHKGNSTSNKHKHHGH